MKKLIEKAIVLIICLVFAVAFMGCTVESDENKGEPKVHSVTYDANGGEFYDGETAFILSDLSERSLIDKPISPKRSGYSLSGWSKSKYISDLWNFDSDTVTEDLILYALWDKVDRDEAVQEYANMAKFSYESNNYTNSLADSTEKALTEEDLKNENISRKIKDIEIANISEGKKAIYKERSANYGLDDLSYYGLNDNVVYAGALLKLQEVGGNFVPLIGVKRKPITLSIGLEGAYGVDYKYKQVDKVSVSSVGQAINELAKGFVKEGAELPYLVALQLTEIKSNEELNAALGLQFGKSSFFNLNTVFDFKEKGEKTYAVLTLKQIFFRVNVDYYSEDGVFSILDDGVIKDQLKNACGEGYCPAYVSSVSYGRIAAITIESNKTFSEIYSELNISGGSFLTSAELNGKLESLSNITDSRYNCFVYGGSASGNQDVLNGGNINDMLNSLNQPYDPTKQVGLPISYQISYLADNSSAKLAFTGTYYYAEIVDAVPVLQPGKTYSVSKSFNEEYRVDDNYGKYDKYGSGYIANSDFISVDVSLLDLDYIKNSDCYIEIVIEMCIKEKDDGYQEIYIYKSGVDKNEVLKHTEKPIGSCQLEHGVNFINSTYQKYYLTTVVSPESLSKDKIWIAFDAWGNDEDTWFAKDITITLSMTSKAAHTMYYEKG